MTDIHDIIENCRAEIVGKAPLLSKLVCTVPYEIDNSIPTLATNGEVIKVNELFITDNLEELFHTSAYLHEVVHIWLGHHLRVSKDMDRPTAQEAADYVTNAVLKDMDFPVKGTWLYELKYSDMAFEQVYEDLLNQQQGQSDPPPKWDENSHGEVLPDESQGEEREKKEEAHEEMQMQSIAHARMMGNLPQSLERVVDKLKRGKQNWRDMLAEFLYTHLGKDDYTYTRPNHRYNGDFIMPGLYSEKVPEVAVAVDTSISIGLDELKQMAEEIILLIEDVEPEETHVIWCDACVQSVQSFKPEDVIDLVPRGGGGTDFRPPFEWVANNAEDVEVMIYLTDGMCNRFPEEPPYPVIWVVWQDAVPIRFPFGQQVLLDRKSLTNS
jgi:predicted metal-dependent peptidase